MHATVQVDGWRQGVLEKEAALLEISTFSHGQAGVRSCSIFNILRR